MTIDHLTGDMRHLRSLLDARREAHRRDPAAPTPPPARMLLRAALHLDDYHRRPHCYSDLAAVYRHAGPARVTTWEMLVAAAAALDSGDTTPAGFPTDGRCPRCGEPLDLAEDGYTRRWGLEHRDGRWVALDYGDAVSFSADGDGEPYAWCRDCLVEYPAPRFDHDTGQ